MFFVGSVDPRGFVGRIRSCILDFDVSFDFSRFVGLVWVVAPRVLCLESLACHSGSSLDFIMACFMSIHLHRCSLDKASKKWPVLPKPSEKQLYSSALERFVVWMSMRFGVHVLL